MNVNKVRGLLDIFDNDTKGKVAGTLAVVITLLTGAAEILQAVLSVFN